jgi:hypothetical protein
MVKPKVNANEYLTTNGITIYGTTKQQVYVLAKLLAVYGNLFADKGGTIQIDPTRRMHIPLIDGWQSYKILTKVYPLSKRNRKVVNKTFNKMHWQGHIK